MERRSILRVGAISGIALLTGAIGPRQPASVLSSEGPYGPLLPPDGNGVALPEGFSSRVVATTDQAVSGTSYTWHRAPDGGATFGMADGGWIYVSNSEVSSSGGGVGMLRFDAGGQVVDARRILSGSSRNCAGGPTPWGTWLSCEETTTGQVWECDPAGEQGAVAHPAMGRFRHEAVAVDPVNRHLYLTEDEPGGGFYRFVPSIWPDLSSGTLEVMTESGGTPGWVTVPDPDGGTTSTRSQVASMKEFRGGEGAWYDGGKVYFTTKGDNRVWTYEPDANRLEVIYDRSSSPNPVLSGVDNVTVSASGDVYVAEDAGNMELVLLTSEGEVAPFMRLNVFDSEVTGPAFDPSGTRLYFSSQRNPGRTYEVTGPFRMAGTAEKSSGNL